MKRIIGFFASIGMLAATSFVSAQQVNYEISATVTYVDDMYNRLQGGLQIGQKISGTYNFETSIPDSDSLPEYAYYDMTNSQATGFDLVSGNLSFKSDPSQSSYMNVIHIGNNTPDTMHIGTWGSRPLANGTPVWDINIDLIDDSGNAFNNTELSATAPDLNKFNIKDMHVSGESFWFIAKIDSITVPGVNSNPDLVVYNLGATVSWVNDIQGDFDNAIAIGQPLSGKYTFNLTTPDINPDPQSGHFIHLPGSGDFGFDFSVAGLNFKSDPTQAPMVVDLYNSQFNDNYIAFTNMLNVPLTNGAVITDFSIYMYDGTGQLISSDQLSTTAPLLNNNGSGWAEIYIGGRASNGIDYFSINATINSVSVLSPPDPNVVVLSPPSGLYDRMQMFDTAIILAPNLPTVDSTSITLLLNGRYQSPTYCTPGSPNPQNRQTFICPGMSFQLNSGKNNVSVRLRLLDGTWVSRDVEWEIISY